MCTQEAINIQHDNARVLFIKLKPFIGFKNEETICRYSKREKVILNDITDYGVTGNVCSTPNIGLLLFILFLRFIVLP